MGYVGLPLAGDVRPGGLEVVGIEADTTRCKRHHAGTSYIGDVTDAPSPGRVVDNRPACHPHASD